MPLSRVGTYFRSIWVTIMGTTTLQVKVCAFSLPRSKTASRAFSCNCTFLPFLCVTSCLWQMSAMIHLNCLGDAAQQILHCSQLARSAIKKKKEDGKSVVPRRLPQHPGLACLERGKRQLYTTPERANYSFKRAPELGACDRGPARRRKCPGRRTAAARFEVGYAFEHCCGATAPQGSESGRRPGGGLGGQPQQLLLPRRLSSSRCSAGHDDTASGSVSSVSMTLSSIVSSLSMSSVALW